MKGVIHSIQSMGMLDGPGLRTVIFFQGCALQCKFCHSIDTTLTDRGEEVEVGDLYNKVMSNSPYWESANSSDAITGGVTISGGDPLNQPLFLQELSKRFHESGVHVAVETSLYSADKVIEMISPHVNLWMVSLKHMDEDRHKEITGRESRQIHENLMNLDKIISELSLDARIRIRFVVIPGMTDSEEHIKSLGRFVKRINNLEQLELLPYTSMGSYKWVEVFGKYELDGVRDASHDDLTRIKSMLNEFVLDIKM